MSVLDVAVQETAAAGRHASTESVHPQWATLLQLLHMDAGSAECRSYTLRTADGRRGLDFLSGYCVWNAERVSEIRALSFFTAIEFHAPRPLTLRLSFEAFQKVHPALFCQKLVMPLFRDHGTLTHICGNHFLVLKAASPLNASAESLDRFISAIDQVLSLVHSSTRFWQDALTLAA